MNLPIAGVLLVTVVGLGSCNKTIAPLAEPGPQAVLTLQDQSTFTGFVTASFPTDITVRGAGGESRTYPMTKVMSVRYSSPAQTSFYGQAPKADNQALNHNYSPLNAASARSSQGRLEEFRTIPAGTVLQVRNNESISSQTADDGQTFAGVVERDIVDSEGRLAIPRGSDATLVVRSASDQGRMEGRSELAIDVGSVMVEG